MTPLTEACAVPLRCACGRHWTVMGERRGFLHFWPDAQGICPTCCSAKDVAVDPTPALDKNQRPS